MSNEAVKWAMDDAPMLLTEKGKPDTTSRHVLQALAEHAHRDGTNTHPSNQRLQYRTGYDERTIRRALRRLEDGGLIAADGTVGGRTRWKLAMHLVRPASDWADLEAAEEKLRQAVAERVRRHRAKRVTDSTPVTETDSVSVTGAHVTDSVSVRNALEVRYMADVTHAECVSNALNAPLTIKNHPTTEPPNNNHPAPAPVRNLPAVRAAAEVDNRPAWLAQLQAAMSASGIDVPWKFQGTEQLLLENDVKRLGIPRMVRFAVDAKASANKPPFSSRWFYPGWRDIPTPVDTNVLPMQPKSRQQAETDDMFDRAAARAIARMQQKETS